MNLKAIHFFKILSILIIAQMINSCASCPYECGNIENIEIMGKGRIKTKKIISFINETNPDISRNELSYIIDTYKEESKAEGVNSDVAIAQMILETGFLKFDGIMDKSQNNFAGIGADRPGKKGSEFPDIKTGIRAQIQHLKAYGCTSALNNPEVDTRFHLVSRGSATTVLDLSGEWSVDMEYGRMIVDLINRIKK